MRSIRRILIAIKDPGAKNSPAVIKGVQLARALRAELFLFHAIAMPLYLNEDISLLGAGLADVERTTRETCLDELNAIARSVGRGIRRVRVSAEWSFPFYEAIIREAGRVKADLIVAERHAGWHTPRTLLQLTDWELLRLSPIPVLLVGRSEPYRSPRILAAVDPDHTDAKPARLDRTILRTGFQLAEALHGKLHAVHAYVPVPIDAYVRGTTELEVARMRTRSSADAQRKLENSTRFLQLARSQLHVIGRHPADAIEETAAKARCAIVVMGAISRRGVQRLLFGNTAERVLDALPCDLLIIKPPRLSGSLSRTRRSARSDIYVLP